MYRYNSIKIFVIFALVATACSDSSDTMPEESSAAMRFNAVDEWSRALTTTGEALRAKPFAVWADYGPIGGGADPVWLLNAEPVSYNGTSWSYAHTRYWFAGLSYNFIALHPADEGATASYDPVTHTLTLASYDVRPATDILAATFAHDCVALTSVPEVVFRFNHLLSRIDFVAEVDAALGESRTIKSATVKGIPATGSWSSSGYDAGNADYGTWTPDAGGAEMSPSITPVTIAAGSSALLFDENNPLLVIPQEVPLDAVFEIEYYEGTDESTLRKYSVRLSAASAALTQGWQPGRTYRYRFVIGAADYIIFYKPSVAQWEYREGGNFNVQEL